MDTTKEFTAIEWCAGYGGIHLGLKRAIPNLRVIAYGEIEAFAASNLVAKMEAGLLDAAPIWTDIKTFPCEAFRDRVGLLVAGYPCQPFSAAGKRLGAEDPRHLWPHIARAIRVIRPRLCFFENVEGHISLGLREVLGDLGAAGYTAAWGIFSASEVGAPHQRKRVFILAVSNSLGGAAGLPRPQQGYEGIAGVADHCGGEGGGELADANGRRFQQCESKPKQADNAGLTSKQVWPSRPGEPQHAWEPPRVVADSKKHGWTHQRIAGELDSTTGSEASRRDQPASTTSDCGDAGAKTMGNTTQRQDNGRESSDLGQAAGEGRCGDDAADGAGEVLGNADHGRLASGINTRSSAEADRGGQGDIEQAESGQIESNVGLHSHGNSNGLGHAELSGLCDSELAEIREWMVKCDNRTDELRLLGNGVVPATAERAFLTLWEELFQQQPTN